MRGSTRGGSQSCSSQPSWHARQQELSDLLSTNPASAMSHLAATALPWALLPSLEQIRLGLAGDRSHRRSPAWQRLPRRCAQGGEQPAPLPGRCVAPGTLLHSHGVAARLRHARVLLAWSWKLTTKQRGFLSGKRFTPSLSTHEKHQTGPPRAFSSLSLLRGGGWADLTEGTAQSVCSQPGKSVHITTAGSIASPSLCV